MVKWTEILRAGSNYSIYRLLQPIIADSGGHPEGYLEAFANIYRNFACWSWAVN
jgi:hypothetical protein